jgi:hypothetical protein
MEQLINKLPQTWEDRILPLMTLHDKFVLGGSLALHILKIMDYDFKERTPDLDFSLTEPFEEKEFMMLVDFFNLSVIKGSNDYGDDGYLTPISTTTTSLKKELIMLEVKANFDDIISGADGEWRSKYYKVDFFNKDYLEKRDWFELDYFGTPIKLTHPSIIFSAKMKYATDNRVGKQYKHFQDIQKIDWDKYFKIVKRIQSHHKEIKNEGEGYQPFKYVVDKYVFEITPIPNYDGMDELPF